MESFARLFPALLFAFALPVLAQEQALTEAASVTDTVAAFYRAAQGGHNY